MTTSAPAATDLPTTGQATGALTALDFVQQYVISNSALPGGGHHIETTGCARPNPRGKTDNYPCRMCEAQALLAAAN